MDRLLRPRERCAFSGFIESEIKKMAELLEESGEQSVNPEFCKKIAKSFSRSAGRAGKPIVKWTEIQNWFQNRLKDSPSKITSSPKASKNVPVLSEACPSNRAHESPQLDEAGEDIPDLSKLEFEARSSKDRAWYDVEMFLTHRFLSSGEAEVRVRFVGFGAEEDEWVNIKKAVRARSLPFEPSECHRIKVGDLILCLQERRDQAIYYDAHILEIQRKMHDIRGCRCLFLIGYDHDNSEERVGLRRLCRIRSL